jgi:hypothetical protein
MQNQNEKLPARTLINETTHLGQDNTLGKAIILQYSETCEKQLCKMRTSCGIWSKMTS